MKINGEGIYGTRPFTVFGEGPTDVQGGFFSAKADLTEKDFRFTAKGDTVFAFIMGAPRDSVLIKTLKKGNYHNIKSIDVLGLDDNIEFFQEREGLKVIIPGKLPSVYSNCLRIIPEMD
jgi:alpha-L-fucosidase